MHFTESSTRLWHINACIYSRAIEISSPKSSGTFARDASACILPSAAPECASAIERASEVIAPWHLHKLPDGNDASTVKFLVSMIERTIRCHWRAGEQLILHIFHTSFLNGRAGYSFVISLRFHHWDVKKSFRQLSRCEYSTTTL